MNVAPLVVLNSSIIINVAEHSIISSIDENGASVRVKKFDVNVKV